MLRETVLSRTIELIEEQYVFADKARELVERLRANTSEYATAKTDHKFAAMLSRDMADITHDVHLTLGVRMKSDPWPDPPPIASMSVLDEGIAVIKISRFPSTNSANGAEVIREIGHAFLMAANARALILDLRGNKGGDGSSVALATTYLLPPEPKLLVVYRYRLNLAPRESWTWEKLPHETNGPYRPLADKPVCVLVGAHTFSAAEEFAYTLQKMKRATIIGEHTRGGAHPSKRHVIDGTFVLSLPFAETISPFTKSNWEGVGIIPDIPCARKDALKIAKAYLMEQLAPATLKNRLLPRQKRGRKKKAEVLR